jgi:epoxide hydrolase-like predicted phosphatase
MRLTNAGPQRGAAYEGTRTGSLTRPGRPAASPTIRNMPQIRAVITDWGGVLTQPIGDTVRDWIAADQIDWDTYVAVIGPWLTEAYDTRVAADELKPPNASKRLAKQPGNTASNTASKTASQAASEAAGQVAQQLAAQLPGLISGNPVHALERGECAVADFERLLAERLVTTTGGKVIADGLLTRMLSASRPDPLMYQVIRDLRAKGLRTALLSNSWGEGGYPRQDFPGLFDAVVISGEVGMRKPEPRIFLHTAELLDIDPAECVFIDDVEGNVRAAVGCGMTGVHHKDPSDTVVRLTELFANR